MGAGEMKGCVHSRPYLPRTLGVGAARMPSTPSTPWCSGSSMNLAHLGLLPDMGSAPTTQAELPRTLGNSTFLAER